MIDCSLAWVKNVLVPVTKCMLLEYSNFYFGAAETVCLYVKPRILMWPFHDEMDASETFDLGELCFCPTRTITIWNVIAALGQFYCTTTETAF